MTGRTSSYVTSPLHDEISRMDRDILQQAAAAFVALPFPRSPVDPDLGDWIMDLLEADTYYAGLTDGALSGVAVDPPPESDLAELSRRLAEIRVAGPNDQEILDACRTYLSALSALHRSLRS